MIFSIHLKSTAQYFYYPCIMQFTSVLDPKILSYVKMPWKTANTPIK